MYSMILEYIGVSDSAGSQPNDGATDEEHTTSRGAHALPTPWFAPNESSPHALHDDPGSPVDAPDWIRGRAVRQRLHQAERSSV